MIGALPPRPLHGHKPRIAEQREMRGNPRLRQIEPCREIGHGRIPLPQESEQPQPGLIGKRVGNPDDGVHSIHLNGRIYAVRQLRKGERRYASAFPVQWGVGLLRKRWCVMERTFGMIGVPSSAGAHWPGQEKAPQALRSAGLVERLRARGCAVTDHGDLPRVRMRPDAAHRQPQNLALVLAVARTVADRVGAIRQAGETPLVIGGDCTIELGVLSGLLHGTGDIALLYFDGGIDLRTPAENPTGILDSMGVAHMIAEPGAAEELARIGPRYPLMPDDRIVLFGYEPNTTGPEEGIRARRGMAHYPAARVREAPPAIAREARTRIEGLAGQFALHFDVDVMDFTDVPVADVPQHNAGLTLDATMDCLRVFAASPQLAALTITEFNPDHADEDGADARIFADALAGALTAAPVS